MKAFFEAYAAACVIGTGFWFAGDAVREMLAPEWVKFCVLTFGGAAVVAAFFARDALRAAWRGRR